MKAYAEDLSAAPAGAKPRFGALRRWWIEAHLPGRDSDLTAEQWNALAQRYIAAGGTAERFEALIEVNVRES